MLSYATQLHILASFVTNNLSHSLYYLAATYITLILARSAALVACIISRIPFTFEFFVSYGLLPMTITSLTQIDLKSYPIQSLNSSACGQYCIFCLYQRAPDIHFSDLINALRMRTNPDLCPHLQYQE